MVAHAVEAHGNAVAALDLDGTAADMLLDLSWPGAVLIGDPVGSHLGAVPGHPAESLPLQSLFVAARAHEHIIVHAGFFQDLRQHPMMAEAVHAVARVGGHAEFFPEIALGIQPLADKGFPAGYIAVRLDPPAAHNDPSAFPYPFADLFKHGGLVFLHPLIACCRAAGEEEVVILLHPVQCGAEGRLDLLTALLPPPVPYQIQMCVSDHIQCLILFSHSPNPSIPIDLRPLRAPPSG